MGQFKSKLSIIVCGLDNSGKTTIVNQLKSSDKRVKEITPTVGYSVEKFSLDKATFRTFDMGGAKKFRSLWENYYSSVDAIVFVIDSTDTLRMCVVRDEIAEMLSNPEVHARQLPFLFFANKMDLLGARTTVQLIEALELEQVMVGHSFNVFPSDALKGIGLVEGMKWLQGQILKNGKISKRGE